MGTDIKQRSKIPALITYLIAVIALIAGLVMPIYSASLTQIDFGKMPVMEVFGAVSALLGMEGPLFGIGTGLSVWTYSVNLFGFELNVLAILLIAYAVITVIAVIMLIPVFITKKKGEVEKLKAVKIVSLVEVFALIVLVLPLLYFITVGAAEGNYYLSVVIAFGVTLLMLIFQAIIYKGGSGVIKTLLFALSAAAVLFAVLPATLIIPVLADLAAPIVNALNTNLGIYAAEGVVVNGGEFLVAIINNPADLLSGDLMHKLFALSLAVLAIMIIVNLVFDMAGLGKRTTKGMLICNLIRNIVTLLALVATVGLLFVLKYTFGIALVLLAVVAVAQLIINIVRIGTFKPAKAAEEEPVVEEVPEVTEPEVVYNVTTVYVGPTDDFIDKLTDEEKAEFARSFLGRRSISFSSLPEYVVGGDNTAFFAAIFIHLSKIREKISDGLIDKFYKEVNMLS